MTPTIRSLISSIAFLLGLSICAEANWPQFRGPDGRSIADGQKLATTIDPQKPLWKTALPTGHSSPTIWDDKIFLTAFEDMQLMMLCLSRTTGELLWSLSRPLNELTQYSHNDSFPSIPTPCTDGERVAFLFGDFGLVVTDLDGKLLWEKKFIPYGNDHGFGYGASPALLDGKLLINCDGSIRPGLLCLDFESGEELWFAERPGTIISFSTPYLWKHDNQTEILLGGSSFLDSYDPINGAANWRVGNLPLFVCPTPVADQNAAYYGAFTTAHVSGGNAIESLFPEGFLTAEQASDADAFYARFDKNKDRRIHREELPPSRLREAFNFTDADRSGYLEFEEFAPRFETREVAEYPGRNVFVSVAAGGEGDITETHVGWEMRKNLPYVSSPLIYKDRLYLVKKGGTVSCLKPSSGESFYERKRLGASGEYYASPIGVDDKVIIASLGGKMIIIKAADEFEILSTIDFKERILASPALVDNRLYLRTDQHLYAF